MPMCAGQSAAIATIAAASSDLVDDPPKPTKDVTSLMPCASFLTSLMSSSAAEIVQVYLG